MKTMHNAPQYRKGWTVTEDMALAKIVLKVVQKNGSNLEGCRAAARELGRSLEGTKTRWRALNEPASYYRRCSITDNGVRVSGQSIRQEPVASPMMSPNFFDTVLTPTASTFDARQGNTDRQITITVGGRTLSGTPGDLRQILGI